ncbi:MAG: NCS2 family permease [Myxococcales bacterium]|jgi:AGZA family xanthine/uracil permease-like MFS transporter
MSSPSTEQTPSGEQTPPLAPVATVPAEPALRLWNLAVPRSRIGTELLAGATTFVVMSYIIVVNPLILGFVGIEPLAGKGLPFAAAVTSTCLVAGLLSVLMGLYTNRALALAPGMGLNAVVAFQLVASMGLSWPAAMGVIFIEGVLVTLLVLTGFREAVMNAVPVALKKAISVGIGLFILFIGLWQAGIVVQDKSGATPIAMGELRGIPVLVAVVGLVLTIVLTVKRVKGALILSILATTAFAVVLNLAFGGTAFATPGVATLPANPFQVPDFSIIGAFEPLGVFKAVGALTAVLTIFSILLADFFDTLGTLVGVGSQAGYLDEEGRFEDVNKPLLIDSLGAALGGVCSSSSCTTYVESQAGVQAGGRTGLTAVVTGLLFFLFMPLAPLVAMVPKEATSGALIAVGVMMTGILINPKSGVDLSEPEEAWPVVTTFIVMPLTYSITNGIGAGFIVYTLVRLIRRQRNSWVIYAAAGAFLIYFLRGAIGGLVGG